MADPAGDDSDELQALFDRVAGGATAVAPAPAVAALPADRGSPDLAGNGATDCADDGGPAERLLTGIGTLTRALHNNLRELGYDRAIEEAAHAIPDARDRLSYVATMTEQAAQRALTATELAKPIQDRMAAGATALSQQWQALLARQLDVGQFRGLVDQTRAYLDEVPQHVSATNMQLMEIMMAQDFQDLTGQVIKKVTDIIQLIEQQLVTLLVENTPVERRSKEANSLLNGPVIKEGTAGVVTSQKQVDDLLDSLGF